MSPEELIRSTLTGLRAILHEPEFTDQYVREFDEIVGRLDPANTWHPASEPPEEDGDYLTIWHFNNGKPSYRVLTFAKDARRWDQDEFKDNWKNKWIKYDSEYGFYETSARTWMPLPKAPESIEQEEANE